MHQVQYGQRDGKLIGNKESASEGIKASIAQIDGGCIYRNIISISTYIYIFIPWKLLLGDNFLSNIYFALYKMDPGEWTLHTLGGPL